MGTDGDYAIDNINWRIYGPKSGGTWGTGQGMLPRDINQPVFGGSAGQGGGSGTGSMGPSSDSGTVFTNAVLLSGTGRAITAPGGNIIPEGLNLSTQSNLNKWIEDSLRVLDSALPIAVVDDLPDSGGYQGDMVLKGASLYVWNGSEWKEIAGGGGEVVDLDGYATNAYVDTQDNALGDRIDVVETSVATKASKQELTTATAALPYRLETDKVVRDANLPAKQSAEGDTAPASAGGEIQLVDNLGMFYNVTFTGTNGVVTSSTAAGIVVDGSGLMPRNFLSLPELQ